MSIYVTTTKKYIFIKSQCSQHICECHKHNVKATVINLNVAFSLWLHVDVLHTDTHIPYPDKTKGF